MKKLFKKLAEQLEVQEIKNRTLSEAEKEKVETELIYNNLVEETNSKLIEDEENNK